MKKILLPFLLLTTLLAFDSCSTSKKAAKNKENFRFTANAPDYEKIKKEINTKNSEFYYPELLRRFEAADTTMTKEQMRHLYYGAATLPDYNPYRTNNYDDLHKALDKKTRTKEDWEEAARVVEEELKIEPTNIRFHLYKNYIYENLYGPHSKQANDAYDQLGILFAAVASTGNGLTQASAFHVINVTDEYGIMELLGLSPKKQSLVHGNEGQSYDVMELKENDLGLERLYFNITISFERSKDIFGF